MSVLRHKVALITGSSRGIGAAVARVFAREGAKIALLGRNRADLSRVATGIEDDGGRAILVVADVTKFADIETARAQIEQELGPVEILIANAGGNHSLPGPVEEITEAGWCATIDANLTATFLTIKCFLPGMKARRAGNIITISSAAGRRANPQAPIAYAVAKAGIELMTQAVALQAGPYRIRANCIAPSTILTERNEQRIPGEQKIALSEAHPLRRLGTPEDVARAALFLASEETGWITGVILDVAGGFVMSR